MAIDTATKRFAIMTLTGSDELLPNPDSTIDAADRHHLLNGYEETGGGGGGGSAVGVRRKRMAAILNARRRRGA
jgi:hypothetical protein